MIVPAALLLAASAAVLTVQPWRDTPPTMRNEKAPDSIRSVSIDFGTVVDPSTDWSAIDERLDAAGANAVELGAGRVEFTAFDWPAHPGAAAEPGQDHLARAARELQRTADDEVREFGLIVDAYVPELIKEDPSIAGVFADGRRSAYQVSAAELTRGAVGQRLVDYVAALGERYRPASIAVTELFLNASYGKEDLKLFQEMTGNTSWPRDPDGRLDEDAEVVTTWRSEVLAELLRQMREALDDVAGGDAVALEMDVRVDWSNPARGAPSTGHRYRELLDAADRLVLWAYLFRQEEPSDIRRLTATLAEAGFDMERFVVSVGLWATEPSAGPAEPISPERFEGALRAAATHGVADVNVTPLSLMTPDHWEVLRKVWGSSS